MDGGIDSSWSIHWRVAGRGTDCPGRGTNCPVCGIANIQDPSLYIKDILERVAHDVAAAGFHS